MIKTQIKSKCYDNLFISIIAAISITFTAILSISFPFELGVSGFGSIYQRCPNMALESGFTESICEHRQFSNSAWGDSLQYFSMAVGGDSYAPYSLRPVIPIIVGQISKLTLDEVHKGDKYRLFSRISSVMVILNLVTGVLLVLIPIMVFRRLYFEESSNVMLVVLTGVINLGVVQTAPFFMLDMASYLVFMCAAHFFFSRNIFFLSLTACFGILVKEVSIILIIPLIALLLENNKKNILGILYVLLPLLVFVTVRVVMGEDPMSISYGWKISDGEINLKYLVMHVGGFSNILFFAIKVVSGLGGSLLLALYFHRKYGKRNVFFTVTIIMVLAVILANILGASRVPRVVGVTMPFLLFYTLYLLNHKMRYFRNESSNNFITNDR